MISSRSLLSAIALASLSACASPHYVNKGEGETGLLGINEVSFQVHEAYKNAAPDCVAVLPLKIGGPSQPQISADDAAKVRLSLYAHLATQSKRQVRLERADHVLAEVKDDRKALGERLKCNAAIEGEVTEYGSMFLGVYSRVAVGVDLRMIRTADGALLWEGKHVAASHGGNIPMDPVGVAMSVVDAVSNIRDEQILRVTDDLTRRLVSTIPDNKVAFQDDPAAEPIKIIRLSSAEAFLFSLEKQSPDEQQKALLEAVATRRFAGADGKLVVDALLAHAAENPQAQTAVGNWRLAEGDHAGAIMAADQAITLAPEMSSPHFLKGRVLMLDRDYGRAEPSIIKAVALDRSNPTYLNALGAVNAEKGAYNRALAAYRMAIDASPANGFAWYNTGVLHYNAGQLQEAADAFYGAGLAYLKTGDYGKAERALVELRDLTRANIPVEAEVKTIQDALTDLTRRKS
ncbi:conserved exported hypothetical protein [Rhodospirillaceae bacterium LM-1]|nr:conserved exported hypothetical protein [Rhodospirillaceae bacterium LM-1]